MAAVLHRDVNKVRVLLTNEPTIDVNWQSENRISGPALHTAAGAPAEDTAPAVAACDLLLERGGPVYQLHVTAALGESLGIDRLETAGRAEIDRRFAELVRMTRIE